MRLTHLRWDSDFFGMKIGRAEHVESVEGVLNEAADRGYQCVYIDSDHEIEPPVQGLVAVDVRVQLRCEVARPRRVVARDVRVPEMRDRPELNALLEVLVPWSRFARDERFGPEQARRMYEAWLARALDGRDAIGVTGDVGYPTGFITVSRSAPREIGLVAAKFPGRGIGGELIEWAKDLGSSTTLDVVTQASNAPALGLYKGAGFVETRRTFAYHLWARDV